MLLSFTFDNFNSFDEMTEFSMVAGSSNGHIDHISDVCGVRVLNAAVIYGANAAGKSSLIDAMYVSKAIVQGRHIGRFSRRYCRCKPTNKTRPSNFQYIFTHNNKTFQFGFEIILSEGKLLSEWLYETNVNTVKEIYTANYTDGKYRYSFPTFDDKCRTTLDIFSESLVDDRSKLLITELSDKKFKEEQKDLEIFHEIFKWFKEKLWINQFNNPTSEESLDMISGHLARYDTDISSARFELENDAPIKIPDDWKENLEEGKPRYFGEFKVVREEGTINTYGIHMIHGSCNESFWYSEESSGTQAAAVICATIFDNTQDRTFIFDEFGSDMHPIVVNNMVNDYLKISKNSNNQLIMATHHTGIMSLDIFRKDEIWFIEKKQGCSELYSLEEFESDARVETHLQRSYLEGRFGALPICTELENQRMN